MQKINSLTNPKVKSLRALHDRRRRRLSGLFLAEGVRIVTEAFDLGWTPEAFVFGQGRQNDEQISHLIASAEGAGADIIMVSEDILAKISRKDNPQMVVASFEERWASPESVFGGQDGIWVVLDRVRDPGNLGTILRTADAVAAKGVVLVGECCDAFSVETVRASMGAIFTTPLVQMSEDDFIAGAGGYSGSILGTALPASTDYRTPSWQEPVLLMMGNEQSGLSSKMMAAATELIQMPMQGRADSLNLAVATGIALYEFMSRKSPM